MLAALVVVGSLLVPQLTLAEVPAAARKQLSSIRQTLKRAGQQYRSNEFERSGSLLKKAKQQLDALPASNPEVEAAAKPLRDSLAKARRLLDPKLSGKSESEAQALADNSPSFSLEIASTLAARCLGCHGETRPRRQLRLDTFDGLMRGSTNGEVVDVVDPPNSLIVLKIKGEADGDRMPPNGDPLSPEFIALVEKWIGSGAKFDGRDPQIKLDRLADELRRQKMTASELLDEAKKTAIAKWQRAFPNQIPEIRTTDHLLLVSKDTTEMDALTEVATNAFDKAATMLTKTEFTLDSPLTVFHVPKRYDYGEFVQMVDGRDSPPAENQFWSPDGGVGYVVVGPAPTDLKGRSSKRKTPVVDEPVLTSMLTTMLLNRWSAPTWYAEGIGRRMLERLDRTNQSVTRWKTQAPAAARTVKSSADLLAQRMPQQVAESVTWAFARFLNSDLRRASKLHSDLAAGVPFERAFVSAFGMPPKDIGEAWLVRVGGGNPNSLRRDTKSGARRRPGR